ncbi:MlaD family protein [Pirellulaceae bacterium]|jgi:phospholipid/cholesterol/gamma-HCH transport system substrate-binding protein|nr:MlaD family protein [Pirellulaceae bacterium]
MDEKVMFWRLGVLVLSTILVAATLILYLGRGFQPTYRILLSCEKAPNVTPETPVQRNGILIGRVDKVETLDEGGVRMTLRINRGVRLFSDEIARIGMTSILGESLIEFVPGRGDKPRSLLVDKSLLTNGSIEVMMGPMDILEQAVSVIGGLDELQETFTKAADSVKETSDAIGSISQSVKKALGDEPDKQFEEFFKDVRKLSQQAGKTLETYQFLAQDVRDVIGTDSTKETLRQSIDKIPRFFDKADDMLGDTKNAISEFRSVAQNANKRLDEIGEITKPFADDEFGKSLRESLDGIGDFLADIKEAKGTLGLLINDPSVYNRLDNGLRRVESISYQLEPILNDVRVFTSKISTDPRILGVKGALDRRPSGSGIKGGFLMPQPSRNENTIRKATWFD